MMKLALGIGAAGLIAAATWQVGPERAFDIALDALTPSSEIVQDVKSAIDALMDLFEGPGDFVPDA
jgi:hypothetical protein